MTTPLTHATGLEGPAAAATGLKLQIIDSAVDYAIFSLRLDGVITTWNEGARRIFGWPADTACGKSAAIIFTSEDRARGVPEQEIEAALKTGRSMDERWHVRNDGTDSGLLAKCSR